ncbi:MAG: hypothetical protein JXQ82_04240 [Methanomicrobiaceae archaeon]|nr:hypothetical protein [Methanomicrobiaceae archaeon]
MDKLVPVKKGLKDELIQYGECVPRECYVNQESGSLWRKKPDGTFTEITKDKGRVITAIKHYNMTVEKRRERCRQGRKEWFREDNSR